MNVPLAQKALNILNTIYKDNPNNFIATSLENIGCALHKMHKFDKALEHFEKAIEVLLAIHKEGKHSEIENTYMRIASTYKKMGFHDKIVEYLEKASQASQNISEGKDKLEKKLQYDNYIADAYYELSNNEPTDNITQIFCSIAIIYQALEDYELIQDTKSPAYNSIKQELESAPYSELAGDFSESEC